MRGGSDCAQGAAKSDQRGRPHHHHLAGSLAPSCEPALGVVVVACWLRPPPVQSEKPLTLKWEKEVGGPRSSHPGLGGGLFLVQNQATHFLLVPQMRVGKV